MENLFVTSFVLERSHENTLLHFNFNENIKIRIYLSIEYSIVKNIFREYFNENLDTVDYKKGEQQCWFSLKKHLTLRGAINLVNRVSNLTCELLDYVRDYTREDCEVRVPVKYIVITEKHLSNIAKNIIHSLEE